MKHLGTITLLGCCLLLPLAASPQSACPAVSDIRPESLVGVWDIELDTQPLTHWTLQLRPHPEHEGSLRGELTQGQKQAWVVADWDDGEFTMEESHDGQRIAATWLGTASAGQCGQQLEGSRQSGAPGHDSPVRFTMRSSRPR